MEGGAMEIGMVGLGRMGSNMSRRLIAGGHHLVVYDPSTDVVKTLVDKGAVGAVSLSDMVLRLTLPRTVWLMVPAGKITENTINDLANLLDPGDIIVDGGNSYYQDSQRRAQALGHKSISFLDAGTSGGIWGFQEGYCLMVGGDKKAYDHLEPVWQTLAPSREHGYGFMGPSGAGHFVKMVHNGIEYGLMQSYAEGFGVMQAKKEFKLDLPKIAEIWRHGSVVRSWLLDLAASALSEDPELNDIEGYVDDSGEGRWTVKEAVDLGVPTPVISASVLERFRSRQDNPFIDKLLAALRQQFGGHPVNKAGTHHTQR
jgi:6-phosphogluconate dehydrogenase